MRLPRPSSHPSLRPFALPRSVLLLAALLLAASPSGADEPWLWPVDDAEIVDDWRAPAHRYGPGHRGIDLRPPPGAVVRAPAAGTVAFVGTVVDRPLITIDHGEGAVTTLEPVASALSPGDVVARGDPVGEIATGGHTAAGAVHFGVRVHGEYVNPRLFVGGVPRAILLPCC
ncbi:murein hydrolase activator EnvC family protein [Microbacterium sp. No. 7]|uniref:murein hydrolase activator EnvC family protein n=1 Tax=Microbacterium sp. No. 7 TaxID=1714373 RepID=UPI0006ECDF9A|nr:M23 family metallopeptidase [Microbacterium sp. No. 7]ALJ20306.1 peptidase M23 [Microbacterium sp. No. 7]